MSTTQKCECEHADHFDGDAHPYGKARAIGKYETDYGPYWICDDCKRHLGAHKRAA